MRKFTKAILGGALGAALGFGSAFGQGFTDSDVVFYGEVRQVGGAGTALLQSGSLEVTFTNQSNAANRVTLSTELRPTGAGDNKPYSYSLKVPMAYLPEAPRMTEYLAVGAQDTDFRIEGITIDGTPATLPDGSKEFYGLSFANRADQYRLDLIVQGDSTDTDGDGLPDWWEILHGLDPASAADGLTDSDGDGWNNLQEFRLGSDPSRSNTEPLLATTEIFVPESGEGGLLLHILDSDTPAADIFAVFTVSEGSGFALKLDGALLEPGETEPLTLTDLQSGRLTVAHIDRAVRQIALPVRWSDGTVVSAEGEGEGAEPEPEPGDTSTTFASFAGQLLVRVTSPSGEEGSDAALWLDGYDLPATGEAIGNWTDRSGNNRHAMQPSADHQPVVADRTADFSSSVTAHLFFQDGAIPSGDHTILTAYRPASTSPAAQTLLSSNRGILQFAATAQATSYPGAARYQMDNLAVRGFENSAGTAATSIFRREGDLLQNIFGLSYDGENVATEAIDPVLPTLGARRPAIPSGSDPVNDAFGGQLHELLVFPTALPEQKLRDVHDYLQSKWGDAVIWDLSTELKSIALNVTGSASDRPHIIRGGHGDDVLGGGSADDTLSGGAGADVLSGGEGSDRFVFGGVDTGRDSIADFDLQADIIDLSALFWGMSGDARQYLSVRLDTNFSTEIPTLDSVFLVQRPEGEIQEIVLRDRVVGATQLIQLIVEGRIRMGGLSIPTEVQLALGSGDSGGQILGESLDQSFTIEVTRSGEGVAAALDVPLGFFQDALGGDFVLEGGNAGASEGRRAVVSFARGETSKILTLRPVPDLESEGLETWQVAVLPHYKYSVGGSPVERTVQDDTPNLWLEVVQANAVVEGAQPARVRVHRDGDLAQSLAVDLRIAGTAEAGVHIESVPPTITIPVGADTYEIPIQARAEGLVDGPKVVLLQLVSRERYQLGNPHEAVLYAAATAEEANGAGFDRWLTNVSGGSLSSLADLMERDPNSFGRYVQAYALGNASPQDLGKSQIAFRVVDGRPEITALGNPSALADVRWGVQVTAGSQDPWADAGDAFVEVPDPAGLKLVGEPLTPGDTRKFYRINLTLDPGQLAGSTIATLTGARRFGISGDARWNTESGTGNLQSSGDGAGETGRIIAEVAGPGAVNFEMELTGAGEGDFLVFYIDGVRQSETVGAAITVNEQLSGAGPHLLMWEFQRTSTSGQAVIRNLP